MIVNESINKGNSKSRIAKLILYFIAIIVVTIIFISIGLQFLAEGRVTLGLVATSIGFLIVTIGGISGRIYNQKTLIDLRLRDEIATFKQYKTGYYSFVGSMYIIVFMMVIAEVITPIRLVFYVGLSLNFIVFIVVYYIVRRQDMTRYDQIV